MPKPRLELTDRQRKFVDAYLVNLNATEAAIEAGYSKTNADKIGSQQLGKTRVRDEVNRRLKEDAYKYEVTKEWILRRLRQLVDRCMQLEPVMKRVGNEWVETGEYKFDSAGATSALNMLGKHHAMFTDKVKAEVEHDFNLSIEMNPTPSDKK